MNDRPIEQAVDADLRLSIVALRRAAHRARDIARRTGTDLVVVEHGKLLHIAPRCRPTAPAAQRRDAKGTSDAKGRRARAKENAQENTGAIKDAQSPPSPYRAIPGTI